MELLRTFVYTVVCYSFIVFFRYRILEKIIGWSFLHKIVIWWCKTYRGWNVYVSSNYYGYCIFNKGHKHGDVYSFTPGNWDYKLIIPYFIFRAK